MNNICNIFYTMFAWSSEQPNYREVEAQTFGCMFMLLSYMKDWFLVEKDHTETGIQSAIKEVGNIIAGAYLSALSSLTNLNIVESIPYMSIDMAGAILSVPAIAFGTLGDKALLIESQFNQIGYSAEGFFILIPTEQSYGKILASLGM